MSEPKYRDWILDTIDSLRSRKARPDLERICRMVRRRHGSDPDRTRAELEKLIQEQTVLKVSYKGSISYRNAAKVQRKSRKKSELTPDRSSGSGESLGEQAKHSTFNNNGDSAHSFTDQEEFGDKDPETMGARQNLDSIPPVEIPGSMPNTKPDRSETILPQTSGNSCLSSGATDCIIGSGYGVKASASKDKRLISQTKGTSDFTEPSKDTIGVESCDAVTQHHKSATVAVGKETHSPCREDDGDKEKKTCASASLSSGSSGANEGDVCNKNDLNENVQQTVFKPKLRVAGPIAKGTSDSETLDQGSADLGDRLVESVRSLTERSQATAATRGPTPLGLKEILGYLSTQSGLGEEKLTRSRVKAVLEREVARGRLRRTHLGHIALPARGMGAAKPTRLLKSALQDRQLAKKMEPKQERQPIETDTKAQGDKDEHMKEEDERKKLEQEKQGAITAEREKQGEVRGLQAGVKTEVKAHGEVMVMKTVPTPPIRSISIQGPCSTPSHIGTNQTKGEGAAGGEVATATSELHSEEGVDVMDTSDQHTHPSDTQNSLVVEAAENPILTSSSAPKSCCKVEMGVSSCLLTPTASPRDLGPAEEQGMNGGGFVKVESGSMNPVEWTVADVVNYFTSVGFPEQALAFRTQEIDGKSLLLMQRNDVLTGLSIRLGPALKIYERHVKVLQKTHFQDDGAFC